MSKRADRERERAREQGKGGGPVAQRILAYVRARGGRVTPQDVSVEMDGVERVTAQLALDRLYRDELIKREDTGERGHGGSVIWAYYLDGG